MAELPSFVGTISSFLNSLILAALILFIGFMIGRVIGKIVQRLLHEVELDKLLKSVANLDFSVEDLVGNLISYLAYFVSIVLALDQFGLGRIFFTILAAIVLLVAVFSLLLALKDLVPNLIGGITLSRKKFLSRGDFIEIKGVRGTVLNITLTEIRLQTKSGDMITIPASVILREEITKISKL